LKALLINPFSVTPLDEYTILSAREPLSLEYLAAAAGNHDVTILDCKGSYLGKFEISADCMIHIGASLRQIKNKLKDLKPDLVGASSLFDTQINSVYSIFNLVKSVDKDIITVIGGSAASCYPKESLDQNENIDIAVFGEGECTFRELLDKECTNLESIDGIVYRDNGKIVQNSPRDLIKDLDSLPFPRRDLVPFENYSKQWTTYSQALLCMKTRGLKYVLGRAASRAFGKGESLDKSQSPSRSPVIEAKIQTSRGCPNNCYFCAVRNVWGERQYRMRSAENVLAEMNILYNKYNVRHFGIIDDNFNVSKKRTIAICKGIVESGWDVSLYVDSGLYFRSTDEEVLTWMKKAGFHQLFFAIESGNESVGKNIIGKEIQLSRVKDLTKICKDLGLPSGGCFMVGVPGETKETMAETVKFAIESDFDEVRLYICQPFRGSKVYEDAKKNGWLTKDFDPSKSWMRENSGYLKTPEFSPEDVHRIAENAKEILRQQNRLISMEPLKPLKKDLWKTSKAEKSP
jgi:anaerobic magnesium-protoporphyrin IX monomethyl ester cyclase